MIVSFHIICEKSVSRNSNQSLSILDGSFEGIQELLVVMRFLDEVDYSEIAIYKSSEGGRLCSSW